MSSRRSRLGECPCCATRAVVRRQKERTMGKKPQREGKANKAMLPVMRPDAAGIDIGATEIFGKRLRITRTVGPVR